MRAWAVAAAVAIAALTNAARAMPQDGKSSTTAPRFNGPAAFDELRHMVAIGPRPAGSAALQETRAYITRQLAAAGLQVQEQPFTATTPLGRIDMVNLIVRLPGRSADRILLTGHYDTKLLPNFVGASDGASSAAILIELARALKGTTHEFTYEFVWFDGEEAMCKGWDECGTSASPDNTYGSRYYVKAATDAHAVASIKTMILFDMIGAKDLKVRRETDYSTPWLNQIVWAAAKRIGATSAFIDRDGPVGGDDHLPFVQAGVPSVDLIDLADYPQWHDSSCCDDLDHVSATSLQTVADVTLAALPDIERHIIG